MPTTRIPPKAIASSVIQQGFSIPPLTRTYTYTPFFDIDEFEQNQKVVIDILKEEGIACLFTVHEQLFGEFLARFEWSMTKLVDVPNYQRWTFEEMSFCEKLVRCLHNLFIQKVRRTLIRDSQEIRSKFPNLAYLLSNMGLDYDWLHFSIAIFNGDHWTDDSKGIFETYYSSDLSMTRDFMAKYEIDYDPMSWLFSLLARLNFEKQFDCRYSVMDSILFNDFYEDLIKELFAGSYQNEIKKLACCCHYLKNRIERFKATLLPEAKHSVRTLYNPDDRQTLTVAIIHASPPPFDGGVQPIFHNPENEEGTRFEQPAESKESKRCVIS